MLLGTTATDGTPISKLSRGSEKRVSQQCDDCGKKTETTYANYQRAQNTREQDGKTFCRACRGSETLRKHQQEHGPWNKGQRQLERSGPSSTSWRGGQFISHDGYIMVHQRGENEPRKGWGNYRKRHLVVMEKQLGRPLEKSEVIHHIDGDKQSDDPENLWLTDHAGHRKAHISLQSIGYALYAASLLRFNRETGQYMAHGKLRELLEHPEEGNQQPSTPGMG